MRRLNLLPRGNPCFHLCLLFLLICTVSNPTRAFADDEGVTFPIPVYNELIIVPVQIGGEKHLAILDSGASHCVFDKKLKHLLGTSSGARTLLSASDERVDVEVFESPLVKLGTMDFKDEKQVACYDLSPIRDVVDGNIDCVLGISLFCSSVIQMDFDRGRVTILPGKSDPKAEWGQPMDVTITSKGTPLVPVKIAELTEMCLVDTGCTETLSFRNELFEGLLEHRLMSALEPGKAILASGGKMLRVGVLPHIECGDHKIDHVIVGEVGSESCIGLEYYRRFCATFDLGRKRLYLAKGKSFGQPDHAPAVGMGLVRRNGRIQVDYVQRKAHYAGIEVSDELVSVGGESVTDKPLGEISWMLRDRADANRMIKLGMRHNGEDREISIEIND